MTIRIEKGDLDRWVVDLDEAVRVAPAESRKVVQKGALNIKTDAQRRIGGLRHAPSYPSSITYDTTETATGVYAEIGPDKNRRQGALGNLLEYGSVNNPPHPHMIPAGEAEVPKFEKAMEDLAAKPLEG
ncbi:hypothetical protein ABGB07_02325 [Micromonosporaceae bacterium B7E4]